MRPVWLAALLFATVPAFASPDVTCPTEAQVTRFGAFRDRIEGAPSTEKAKKIASSKLRLGGQAIDAATGVVADPDDLSDARARIAELQLAVDQASSPGEVAAAFDSVEPRALRCEYDKVEVALIVLGFILGIIPGIIFLFLFC